MLSRRSVDGGRTWGPIQVVHSESTPSNHVTIGNPSPVVLSTHPGCIVLFFCRNNMKVGSMVSHDDGKTWGLPNYFLDVQSAAFRSLLSIPANKNVSHIASGPPTSLQLDSGRVLIPTAFCLDGRYAICSAHAPGDWFAATLYSDDIDDIVNGNDATWHVSNKNEQGNECQVSQTQNGSLLLNQRTGQGHRQLSWSSDGGATWSKPEPYALGGPEAGNCCCSTVLVPSNAGHKHKQNIKSTSLLQENHLLSENEQQQNKELASPHKEGTLVFSGPDAKSRTHMTLYTSSDSGANWSKLIQVFVCICAFVHCHFITGCHFSDFIIMLHIFCALSFLLPLCYSKQLVTILFLCCMCFVYCRFLLP